MSEETGGSKASGDARIAEMERAAEDIRQKLNQLVEQQRAGRVQMLLATVAILVIVTVFGFKMWGRMEENFSTPRIEKALADNGPLLMQEGQRALEQAAEQILPLYQEMALERAKVVGPKLLEEAERELVSIPEDLGDDLEARLNNSLETVRLAVLNELEKKFPFLANADDANESLAYFKEKVLVRGEAIQAHTDKIIEDEKARVERILESFETQEIEKIEKPELTKNLIKTALLYAIYETEVSGTDEGHNQPASSLTDLNLAK